MNFCALRINIIKDELIEMEQAQLVYSLGLFDYLTQEFAARVLVKMAIHTRPGGQCGIANFAPEAANLGDCEAIMDWWMITCSEEQMHDLEAKVARRLNRDFSVSATRHGCFNYLELSGA